MGKEDFQKLRYRVSEADMIGGHRSLPKLEKQPSLLNSPGFRVSEAHNYVTQNQNEFFASSKVFFKPNVPSITALNINK